MVQWVRLHAPDAGGQGSIPGRGTRSRTLSLRSLHAATKDAACWASLVAQWLIIHLPVQGTQVRAPGLGRFHMLWSN